MNLPSRFHVVAELGQGAMGTVYRATDATTGREVALKVLRQDLGEDSLVRRFQREASSMAALDHPSVVRMLDVVTHEGTTILVMEYLEGGRLVEFMERGEPIPRVVAVFAGICEGLAHVHAQGIVHRDLKPENIFFTSEGTPKIGDLGLARRTDPQSMLTAAGTILGSFAYIAPEQVISSEVGPSSDLYALGVCLYQALAGRLPFEDKSMFALLQAHLKKAPPPLRELRPEVTETLHALVHQLLAKKPEDRPASALAVRDALLACG